MDQFSLAFTSVDITPGSQTAPNPWMAGYGWAPRGNPSYAKARPLRAQCVVIYDGTKEFVVVRADVVSLPTRIHEAVRDALVARGLITESRFMLLSSHTHSGPALPGQPDPFVLYGIADGSAELAAIEAYGTYLTDALINLVDQARGLTPTPVTLDYVEGHAEVAINRVGLTWKPDEVPVLLARHRDTGARVLAMFGYACHPVARGSEAVFDSDFPGRTSEIVEAQLGCPVFFLQGAAGDRNPDALGSGAAVESVASRLATGVLNAARGTGLVRQSGPIRDAFAVARLPLARNLADPAVVSQLTTIYNRLVPRVTGEYRRFCQRMAARLAAGDIPSTVSVPVQAWAFGEGLVMFAVGGELLSGYHVGLRGLTSRPLWPIAYANEIPCYLPSDDVLWHWPSNPNYESGWTDNATLCGNGTNMMAYGWPVPLASSQPVGTSPATPASAEGALVATCRTVLAQVTAPAAAVSAKD